MVLDGNCIPFREEAQGEWEVYNCKAFQIHRYHRDTAHQYIDGPRKRTSYQAVRVGLVTTVFIDTRTLSYLHKMDTMNCSQGPIWSKLPPTLVVDASQYVKELSVVVDMRDELLMEFDRMPTIIRTT